MVTVMMMVLMMMMMMMMEEGEDMAPWCACGNNSRSYC
jgi:hypothetical protein